MNVKSVLKGYWAHTHCSMIASTGSGTVTDCVSFVHVGILHVTYTQNKLSEVHAKLMAQNINRATGNDGKRKRKRERERKMEKGRQVKILS